MNNVFEGQIRKMQELYIDDMIVKSIEESYNLSHLRVVFQEVQKHNMRLNPQKNAHWSQGREVPRLLLDGVRYQSQPR